MMSEGEELNELDELVSGHLEGVLSENERARLNFLLLSNTEARDRFARVLRQEALLGEVLPETEVAKTGVAPARAWRAWHKVAGLVAASALLIVGLSIWLARPGAPVAKLLVESGTVIVTRGTQTYTSMEALQADDKVQTSEPGTASIHYVDGTHIQLGSGSFLRMGGKTADGKRLHLSKGTLRADVSPQPADAPLVISTPEASITVVGTQFSVSASDGESSIHVIEGRVRVSRETQNRSSSVELTNGQFTSVRADNSELIAQTIKPAQKEPAPPEKRKAVLMVVADPIPFHAHDVAIRSILQQLHLDVIERTFDKVSAADLEGKALVVLPSHKYQQTAIFSQTAVPVIAWHHVWHVDLRMSEETGAMMPMKRRPLRFETELHALAAGLKPADPVFELFTFAWAKPGNQAIVILRAADSEQGPVVYAYEKDAMMSSLAAPARRVGFSLDVRESSGRGVPVDAGARLLKAAVEWCLENPE